MRPLNESYWAVLLCGIVSYADQDVSGCKSLIKPIAVDIAGLNECLPKAIPVGEICHKRYLGLSEFTSPDDIESSLHIDPERDLQTGG